MIPIPSVRLNAEESRFAGTVNWVPLDVGAAARDVGHPISPEERFRVAMVRRLGGSMGSVERMPPAEAGEPSIVTVRRDPLGALWLAALAIQHGMKVATQNQRDFPDIPGLDLLVLRPRRPAK